MPKTKEQKQSIVKALSEKLKGAKSSIIFKHEGLPVSVTQELRDKCREQNVEVFATKKTLLSLALEDQGITDSNVKTFEGGIAVAISQDDEVAGAKIIKEFSKKYDKLEFRGGVLEGKVITLEQVIPISGFVNVLQGNLRGLVCVLNAIKDNK